MIQWEAHASLALADPSDGLRSMQRIADYTSRLIAAADFSAAIEALLDSAIELHNADFANVQLFRPEDNTLEIVCQRGFAAPFLTAFRSVSADDPSACGRALHSRATVLIEDVERDPEFSPYRDVAREAGYVAVQSTPMISSAGQTIGVLSTHFRETRLPSDAVLQVTAIYARQAADILLRFRNEEKRRARETRRRHLAAELDHRLKNIITMVQSISRLSLHGAQGLSDYAEAFDARLQALARAHDRLRNMKWRAVSIADVVHDQLAAFDPARISCSGPDVLIGADAAYTLSLVLHELAVNAQKHGALSVASGRIVIEWRPGEDRGTALRWSERGGPTVVPPKVRGFGTALIGSMSQAGVTEAALRFEPEGVVCALHLPRATEDLRQADS